MEIKRVIISIENKIRDTILAIPSFYMLKKMYANIELIVLVKKYNYDVVKNLPYIDRIIKIDDYTKSEFLEKIAYFKADVFIALCKDEYTVLLAKASRAKIKTAPISKLSSFFSFNKGVLQRRDFAKKNEAEYNLDLIKKLNPNRFRASFEINTDLILDENNIKVANLYFEENNLGRYKKLLLVTPFVDGSTKNLKDEDYASILKKVLTKYKELGIIVSCHIDDEDRVINLKNMIGKDGIYIFANGSSIMNTAGLIKKADVYLGASTGPTHIAGALNKKIVAIYPKKKNYSCTRWGVFNVFSEENVKYIIPDKNNKESYKKPYFDSYNSEVENEVVEALLSALK